jgi:hypothetical protein
MGLTLVKALRLIKVRGENTQRQAQLEERIIAPENDDFVPFKGRASKTTSTKRTRTAASKRFTSNLTPGDLDGKFRQDDDEEDLSAVCVSLQSFNFCAQQKVIARYRVKNFRKNKNWQPPPQSRVPNRSVVEFSSPYVHFGYCCVGSA